MSIVRRFLPGLALGLAIVTSASAHHSTSAYDFKKKVELSGTVKDFQWTNPHCWLELDVTGAGKKVTWTLEAGTPNVNKRMGWTGSDLEEGDKVTVVVHPKRDGSPGGALVNLKLPNGKTLNAPASIFGDKPV